MLDFTRRAYEAVLFTGISFLVLMLPPRTRHRVILAFEAGINQQRSTPRIPGNRLNPEWLR